MGLRLSKLLEQEDLGLELVAGAQGLDTRGDVAWVHASELPIPGPWLQDHTILLTTGFGIKTSVKLQRQLMIHLDERQSVGLGIGLGDWLSKVPKTILNEAEKRSIPVFLVPYSVPFSLVTRRVADLIILHENSESQHSADIYRRLLALVVAGKDPRVVIEGLLEDQENAKCVLFDYFGQVSVSSGPMLMTDQQIWERIRAHASKGRILVKDKGVVIMGTSVTTGEEVEGFLVVVSEREFTNEDIEKFELLQTGVQLSLLRNQSPRGRRRQEISELFLDLLYKDTSVPATVRRVKLMNLPETNSFYVVAMASAALSMDKLCGAVEEVLLGMEETSLCGKVDETVIAITRQPETLVHGVRRLVGGRNPACLRAGTSRQRFCSYEIGLSLREAMAACEANTGDAVTPIDDMGARGLLPQLLHTGTAQQYMERVLGPVILADENDGSRLVETVRVYLRHGGRPSAAATELEIHRHTLAYRLNRVAELTGYDPRKGQGMIDVGVAIEILQMLDEA